jgi:hypothetical protein
MPARSRRSGLLAAARHQPAVPVYVKFAEAVQRYARGRAGRPEGCRGWEARCSLSVVDRGRQTGHGNIDANDPKRTGGDRPGFFFL